MERRGSTSGIGLTIAALIAVLSMGFSAAAAEGPKVPSIDWQPCGEAFPTAECAMVEVPLDYDTPHGQQIDLALARIPASNPEEKIGSLFVNPGGPGGSGVDFVLFGWGDYLSAATGGRFDVVGFDPRGIGASTPIRCFESQDEFFDFIYGVPLFPYEEEQKRPFFDHLNEFTAKCLEKGLDITHHMSTADVVRDLDLLRRAVGDSKLTYLGFSYGSHIGNTYANLFPKKVRALVIDGVLNPILWTFGLQIVADRTATKEVFDEFARLCDEAGPEHCALTGPDGTLTRWEALAAALLEEPFVFPDGFVYYYDYLIGDTTSVMYRPEIWGGPDGAAVFFDFLADAVLNRDAWAAEAAREVHLALKRRFEAARPSRDEYDNGFDALFGNHCGDAQYPSHYAGHYAMGEYAEEGSIFGPYWSWFTAPCATWPTAEDRYVWPWRARTSRPVLVVGNYFDPATDYDGAVASDKLLKNSRLLSYAGWGHCAFGRSACVDNYVVQYLLDGSLPPEGTVCPANPNPFLPATARGLNKRAVRTTLPAIGRPPLTSSFR
ncbi:MAG: alpha/beta hydrolase [Myxococcota bacterium]|nr:alpha/beta hydrolase [Myxococcota bacterium]